MSDQARLLRPWLPTNMQTLLLQACLVEEPAAREVFTRWCEQGGGSPEAFADPPSGGRNLGPLLAGRAASWPMPPRLQVYLRTAHAREQARWTEYQRIADAALDELGKAGVGPVVLKGLASAVLYYPEPALRHSRDIDMLIEETDIPAAAAAVGRAGFVPEAWCRTPDDRLRHQVHPSGLSIVLHRGLFLLSSCNALTADAWARRTAVASLPAHVRVLAPEDALIHICVHATTGRHREGLLWVPDAFFLLARYPVLDWNALVDRAAKFRFSLRLLHTLRFLADALGAAVPARVLEALSSDAVPASRTEWEIALGTAGKGPDGSVGALLRHARHWRTRLDVLRWKLLPTPQYLVVMERARPWTLPVFYFWRISQMLWRRFATRSPGTASRTGVQA